MEHSEERAPWKPQHATIVWHLLECLSGESELCPRLALADDKVIKLRGSFITTLSRPHFWWRRGSTPERHNCKCQGGKGDDLFLSLGPSAYCGVERARPPPSGSGNWTPKTKWPPSYRNARSSALVMTFSAEKRSQDSPPVDEEAEAWGDAHPRSGRGRRYSALNVTSSVGQKCEGWSSSCEFMCRALENNV